MYTDLTLACPHCLYRVRASRTRCPRCHRTGLCDASALPPRAHLPPDAGERYAMVSAMTVALAAFIAFGAAFVYVVSFSHTHHNVEGDPILSGEDLPLLLFACVASLASGGAVFLLGKGVAHLGGRLLLSLGFTPRDAPAIGHEGAEPADPPSPEALTGRVVAPSETVVSPLSGRPCVACRIVGRVNGVDLDDALAASFVLETPDGRRVWVDASSARLALTVGDARPLPEAQQDAMRAFLTPRGAWKPGAHSLAEALLVEGDEVVLDGVIEAAPETAARGYRDGATLVARATAAHPLTLRSVERSRSGLNGDDEVGDVARRDASGHRSDLER